MSCGCVKEAQRLCLGAEEPGFNSVDVNSGVDNSLADTGINFLYEGSLGGLRERVDSNIVGLEFIHHS